VGGGGEGNVELRKATGEELGAPQERVEGVVVEEGVAQGQRHDGSREQRGERVDQRAPRPSHVAAS
jgi:hypothetical protein